VSRSPRIKSLGQLVDLRERELDRLGADMASRRATRERYIGNLARLEKLCQSSGASGAPTPGARGKANERAPFSPHVSLNCGSYKQAVMKMADAHRVDLSLHEADMAVAKRVLLEAARRHEALDQELTRQREGVRKSQNAREQKRQDDLALQVWRRGRK